MAHRQWVVNASPLILLGKTNQIDLLGDLTDQIAIPKAVVEIVVQSLMAMRQSKRSTLPRPLSWSRTRWQPPTS